MPTPAQRQSLTEIWRILEKASVMGSDSASIRMDTLDKIVHLRAAPGEMSDASIIALRQKLEKLHVLLEEYASEIESAYCITMGMSAK